MSNHMNKHLMFILILLGVFILYTMGMKEGLDTDDEAEIEKDVNSWAGVDEDSDSDEDSSEDSDSEDSDSEDSDEEFRGIQEGFLSGSKVKTFQEGYQSKKKKRDKRELKKINRSLERETKEKELLEESERGQVVGEIITKKKSLERVKGENSAIKNAVETAKDDDSGFF